MKFIRINDKIFGTKKIKAVYPENSEKDFFYNICIHVSNRYGIYKVSFKNKETRDRKFEEISEELLEKPPKKT